MATTQKCGKLKDPVTEHQKLWEHLWRSPAWYLQEVSFILPQLQLRLQIPMRKRARIIFYGLDAGISAIKLMIHTRIYYNFGKKVK